MKPSEAIRQGVEAWHAWRKERPGSIGLRAAEGRLDLSGVDLSGADLSDVSFEQVDFSGADLSKTSGLRTMFEDCDLSGASLRGAHFDESDFRGSDLRGATLEGAEFGVTNFQGCNLSAVDLSSTRFRSHGRPFKMETCDLSGANLSGLEMQWANFFHSNLTGANLEGADLNVTRFDMATLAAANLRGATLAGCDFSQADLTGADLRGANLCGANLVKANLTNANLDGSTIYGISIWDPVLDGVSQSNLVITPPEEASITVDNLEVAQFVYLLLRNSKVRDVIDTISSKAVLILGRFTPERMAILDALRAALRERGYVPILFDFDKPAGRDLTETITTLARMARFIVADLTDARSIGQELQAIVPDLPSLPVQPILQATDSEYALFEHLRRYPWVLETYLYDDPEQLLANLGPSVLAPPEARLAEQSS